VRRHSDTPRHAKGERAGELNCESSKECLFCSLIEERTISFSLRLKNC